MESSLAQKLPSYSKIDRPRPSGVTLRGVMTEDGGRRPGPLRQAGRQAGRSGRVERSRAREYVK
jgi:hypothetical protein